MKEWITSIVVTSFIVSLIFLILPNGSLNKYIKTSLVMIVLLVIISPLGNLKNFNYTFENYNPNNISLQENYLEYICDNKSKQLEESCFKILGKYNIENAVVNVDCIVDDNQRIRVEGTFIDLTKTVIKNQTEHINILDKIKDEICQCINIDKSNLVIKS